MEPPTNSGCFVSVVPLPQRYLASLAFGRASEFLFSRAAKLVRAVLSGEWEGWRGSEAAGPLGRRTHAGLSHEGVGEARASNACWPGSGRFCVPFVGLVGWASGRRVRQALCSEAVGRSLALRLGSGTFRCVQVRNLVKCIAAQSSVTLPRPSEESVLGHSRSEPKTSDR